VARQALTSHQQGLALAKQENAPTEPAGSHRRRQRSSATSLTYVLDDNGNERQLRAWNATEAYGLIHGDWKIAHSHWAFTQTAMKAIAS
jgi:hypothetical protein